MATDEKKQTDNNKAVIRTHSKTFRKNKVDREKTSYMEGNEIENDEVDSGSVTYFVNDEGRYYKPADDIQKVESLTDAENTETIKQNNTQKLLSNEEPLTVVLVQTDMGESEESFLPVTQEERKPVVNINEKLTEDDKGNDICTFNDEEEGKSTSTEDKKKLRNKYQKDKSYVTVKNNVKNIQPKFTCNLCTYTSNTKYLFLRHKKSHSEKRLHKCSICERGFKTVSSLENHLNMHSGIKPNICEYCYIPFTTSGELVRHVRYKHTLEKPYKCEECDYACVELSKLRRHVRCHTGERPYQCPHCTYASPDTFSLKRHLRTHTGEKPYKCDECNMCFTQSNSLKSHKLGHGDKPVYSCELCPAKLGRKADLRTHVKNLHTFDNPLTCKLCGKTFQDRYSYKGHYKTHEGGKFFKCEVCSYASSTFRKLSLHMLKHTGEKPFHCEHCDKSFKLIQLLRRHQNHYHDPDYVPKLPKEKTHTCHECNRNFVHKGNLIRHLAVHDPESRHYEQSSELGLDKLKMIQPNKTEDLAKLDSYEEDNQNEGKKMKLAEESDDELKCGDIVIMGETDDEQYNVMEVIQLEEDEQQIPNVAPQCGEDEEQQEEIYKIYDDKNEPLLLNRYPG